MKKYKLHSFALKNVPPYWQVPIITLICIMLNVIFTYVLGRIKSVNGFNSHSKQKHLNNFICLLVNVTNYIYWTFKIIILEIVKKLIAFLGWKQSDM